MKYKLKLNHHCEFQIYEINKMPPRAYFIPHSTAEGLSQSTLYNERRLSDKIMLLNGDWSFRYYADCSTMPDIFDTETEQMDTVKVPSDWQRTGYEKPNYLNTRYQFPLNPPVIPQNIPCAVYAKKVDISDIDKVYLINFLGVCACFDLFVNGKFVGYSEGSHNTAEFDITSFVTKGSNEIVAVVYKWCNGSYMECQDMFRENGIFRDVYIIKEEKCYISDFGYRTAYNDNGSYSFTFDYTLTGDAAEHTLSFKLTDREGNDILSDSFSSEKGEKEYKDLHVNEWNAELPYLYDLTVSLYKKGELVSITHKKAGFKHIEIKGNVYYFNNKNIKLLGINHHESHPVNGFVMTVEELERDVKLMKEYNANCVRLSHYPHDPLFLTLCDEYGLYTVDEMDLECHGIYANPLTANLGRISNNTEWANHFMDRAKRMYYRDRSHASIALWSLGNEAGGYKCHDLCYEFFKKVSDIPVQYQGAIATKRFAYDVVSVFYPNRGLMQSIADGSIKDKRYLEKPYFMAEYAHAMGVGPGGLNDLVKIVLGYDNFMGGCIWEFCDHTAYDINHKYKYTYGGDYNEKKHDGNFCVDGLFFPDRSPSTGALNMRECYRPIRARQENGKFIFTNYYSFKDSSDISISWTLLRNGSPMNNGKLDIVIPPMSSVTTDILCPIPRDMSEYVLQITYTDGDRYVAGEDFAITSPIQRQFNPSKPEYKIADGIANITFDKGSISVSTSTGEIISYLIDGRELINAAPHLGNKGILPNMWRLVLDNDRFIKIGWMFLGTMKALPRHKRTKINENSDSLQIINDYDIRGFGKLAKCRITMTVSGDGTMLIDVCMKKAWKLAFYSDIVRCGVTLELDKKYDNIKYYGLGDRETLSDFDDHGRLGVYSLKVRDMHEKYIKPQESGNRSKVRWTTLTDNDGYGLAVNMTSSLLNINANHYTRNDIAKATHIEDVPEADTTCLQVDGFMRGTGTQSCGYEPTAEHRPNLKTPLEYSFILSPIMPNKD